VKEWNFGWDIENARAESREYSGIIGWQEPGSPIPSKREGGISNLRASMVVRSQFVMETSTYQAAT
jgi:hypothetical protein